MKGKKAKPVEEPSAVPESNWEAGLVAAPLVEEGWQACVTLVVGQRSTDEAHMKALLQAVRQPQRRLFCAITWENMIEKINELGNPRGRKPKDVPQFYEVTEPAKAILDAKEELPCHLLAKLLKFLLLVAKSNSMQLGATEHKAAEDQAKDKDKSGASVKPPAKVEKVKKAAEPHTPMKETKLKRRGEEEEIRKFIDDEPDDGPQLYILLLGFHQLQLLPMLDLLGVHISVILCLDSEEEPQEPETNETPECEALEALKRKRQEELDQFWKYLEPLLNSGPPRSKLFDVARLRYTVKKDLVPPDIEDSKAVLAFGTRLFQDVACLIYNYLDWRRQHLYYLDSMKLVVVPAVARAITGRTVPDSGGEAMAVTPRKKPVPEEVAPSTWDLLGSTYRSLMDSFPPEVVSMSLVLHCMLEQVVVMLEEMLPPHVGRSLGKHTAKESTGGTSLGPFQHTGIQGFPTAERMMGDPAMVKPPTEEETPAAEPLLLGYHDDRSRRLQQLPVCHGFDPMKAEAEMQKNTRASELLRSVRSPTDDRLRLARVQELSSFCTDDSLCWAQVERAFSQFELESMVLTGTDQSGRLDPAAPSDMSPNPWDDPVSFVQHFLGRQDQEPRDDSQGDLEANKPVQMSVEAVQKARLRSLTAWHFTEHHSAAIFPQVLESACQVFHCVDTYRRRYDNSLLVVCHNPMGPQRQSSECWNAALHTDVGFRKYLEHVADSISDWLRQEEEKWRAPREKREPSEHSDKGKEESGEKKGSPSPKRMTSSPAMSVEETTKELYIRKDSLKAWKMEQDKMKEDESANKAKKDKAGKTSVKGDRTESSEDRKKTPPPIKQSREDLLKSPEELQPPEEVFTGFIGYSMDGALIQMSGQTRNLFPSDGGLIQVERIDFVEGSTLVQVRVTKDKHHFFVNISDPCKSVEQSRSSGTDTREQKCSVSRGGSFSALLHSGIRLAFSRHGPSGESEDTSDREPNVTMEKLLAVAPSHSGSNPLTPSSSAKRVKASSSPKISQAKLCMTTPALTAPPVSSAPAAEGDTTSVEPKDQKARPAKDRPPFQTLSVSAPTGLVLQFLREELGGDNGHLGGILVRQNFLHCRGRQRTVTSQGTVIKCLGDGLIEVLFADGTVSRSPYSAEAVSHHLPTEVLEPKRDVNQEVMDSVDSKAKMSQKLSTGGDPKAKTLPRGQQSAKTGTEPTPCRLMDNWVTTAPSGLRLATVAEQVEEVPPVSAFKATDPASGTIVVTREDGVFIVIESNGTVTAEHRDGTRITTLYEDVEEPEHPETGSDPPAATRPVKEVLVECEGYATVVMNFKEGTCTAVFGDRTAITATCEGSYEVLPSNGGLLRISEDGSASYASHPDHSAMLPPGGGCQKMQPATYVMRHTSSVACEVTDPEGSLFQVTVDGKTHVVFSNLEDRESESSESEEEDEEEDEEEEEEEEDQEAAVGCVELEGPGSLHPAQKDQSARFFIAHTDGSGTELLSLQEVEDFLDMAESELSTAVLKEPVPDLPEVLGITVLRPCPKDSASHWIVPKQRPDVVPAIFKSRKWEELPASESVNPCALASGSPGSGLCASKRTQPRTPPPVLNCPEVLEVRLLVQYEPISSELRRTLENRLKEYMDHLLRREFLWQEMQLKDPRSEEEKSHATKLLQHFRPQMHPEHPSDFMEKRISNGDVSGLYSQALHLSSNSPDECVPDDTFSRSGAEEHESQWPAILEHHREELRDERHCKEALKNRLIPPYFFSLIGTLFQHTQEAPDMWSLSQMLPPFRRSGQNNEIQRFLREAPAGSRSEPLDKGRPASPVPRASTVTHTSVPSRMGGCWGQKKQWDPPRSAPGCRTSTLENIAQELSGARDQSETSARRAGAEPHGGPVDPAETPQKVSVPSPVLSSKPRRLPNERFLSVEEPVRRKVRTVSVAGARTGLLRGFELHPAEVHFGVLKEGGTYCVPVVLRNVGIDSCRFHVKQPPPATGLRVIYNPRPVAAGMKTELQVELFAMASELQDGTAEGHLSQDVQIVTETEIVFLPVFATVLPAALYDSRVWQGGPLDQAGGTRVQMVSSSPTVGRGALRPTRLPGTSADGQQIFVAESS